MSKHKREIGFRLTLPSGFQITFENGATVSVQFGPLNYCSARPKEFRVEDFDKPAEECPNAEIAGFDKDGNWITLPDWDDSVHGWTTPAELLAYMNHVAGLK